MSRKVLPPRAAPKSAARGRALTMAVAALLVLYAAFVLGSHTFVTGGKWPLLLSGGLNCVLVAALLALHGIQSSARRAAEGELDAALHRAVASEEALRKQHHQLTDASRQAGMAEVATGILHNVGNTLNSINVSVNLTARQLRASKVAGLSKAAALLREHEADSATFLATDPKGKKLPEYIITLSEHLSREHAGLLGEFEELLKNVDHVKEIVTFQQSNAKRVGVMEDTLVSDLVDDALRLHSNAFGDAGIVIERRYAEMAPLYVDRHKLLQILVNLLNNACHSLAASERARKELAIQVRRTEKGRLRICVQDNGSGIEPENIDKLFSAGFTTKKEGHGFGLHMCALIAKDMGGSIWCESEGKGRGAAFTLEMPVEFVAEEPSVRASAQTPASL